MTATLLGDWTPTRVTLDTSRGRRAVDGFISAEAPGLAVTPNLLDGKPTGEWAITHILSGRAVGPLAPEPEDAQLAALLFALLGDWTTPADALWTDERMATNSTRVYEALIAGTYFVGNRPNDGVPESVRSHVAALRGEADHAY